MEKLFEVKFIELKRKNFDDYRFNIKGIKVINSNTIILDDALNKNTGQYSDGCFSLSGEGFGGYAVNFRISKQTYTIDSEVLINYIIAQIEKVSGELK